MTVSIKEALDDCFGRVLIAGEGIPACVGRYPQFAVELERQLRDMLATAQAGVFSPSPDAKDRGRKLLHDELRKLDHGGKARTTPAKRAASRVVTMFLIS